MLVPSRKASQVLGVHPNTLRNWAKNGKIRHIKTPTGQRLYDCEDFLKEEVKQGSKVCYCRVSSSKQRDDLDRQVAFMRQQFPDYEIVSDIGSGLNFKRKGFVALLERVCAGAVSEIVVAHKDRLCRFGFDLISWLIEKNGGKLVVLDNTLLSPREELISDLLSIIHVFSCRMHGLRTYSRQIKEDQALSDPQTERDATEMARRSKTLL